MALTSRTTKTLTIPGEDATVTIRKLSHHMLAMGIDARIDAAAAKMRAFEGITLPEAKDADKADADKPENKYDRLSVLRHGVTAWTYPDPIEAVDDLDEETAAWLFGEIIAFSLRSAADVKVSASDLPPSTGPEEVAGLPS